MLDFLFDLPLVVVGPVIIAALWLFSIVGLLMVRRHVLPRLRIHHEDSELTATVVESIMVFYGLAVALIAVSVSETHSDVSKIVSGEATALAELYRDVSSYPEAVRSRLQNELRDYVRYVIQEAWPLQRRGKVPGGGVERINRFQAILASFEPATEGQKLLHGETLRAYNQMIQTRRLRLDAVNAGLPGVMWIVVVAGAFLGLSSTFFFKVEHTHLQAIQVLFLATFIGLVIFMIFVLDRPFRGGLGLPPEPYQLVYDQLMKP
jgi:hypothetical protein